MAPRSPPSPARPSSPDAATGRMTPDGRGPTILPARDIACCATVDPLRAPHRGPLTEVREQRARVDPGDVAVSIDREAVGAQVARLAGPSLPRQIRIEFHGCTEPMQVPDRAGEPELLSRQEKSRPALAVRRLPGRPRGSFARRPVTAWHPLRPAAGECHPAQSTSPGRRSVHHERVYSRARDAGRRGGRHPPGTVPRPGRPVRGPTRHRPGRGGAERDVHMPAATGARRSRGPGGPPAPAPCRSSRCWSRPSLAAHPRCRCRSPQTRRPGSLRRTGRRWSTPRPVRAGQCRPARVRPRDPRDPRVRRGRGGGGGGGGGGGAPPPPGWSGRPRLALLAARSCRPALAGRADLTPLAARPLRTLRPLGTRDALRTARTNLGLGQIRGRQKPGGLRLGRGDPLGLARRAVTHDHVARLPAGLEPRDAARRMVRKLEGEAALGVRLGGVLFVERDLLLACGTDPPEDLQASAIDHGHVDGDFCSCRRARQDNPGGNGNATPEHGASPRIRWLSNVSARARSGKRADWVVGRARGGFGLPAGLTRCAAD